MPTQIEDLTVAYVAGDLEQLDIAARKQYDQLPSDLVRWFDQELLDRRNRKMIERSERLMRAQSTLVAVGAMHLGRESGLVAGLRARGFEVERLRK